MGCASSLPSPDAVEASPNCLFGTALVRRFQQNNTSSTTQNTRSPTTTSNLHHTLPVSHTENQRPSFAAQQRKNRTFPLCPPSLKIRRLEETEHRPQFAANALFSTRSLRWGVEQIRVIDLHGIPASSNRSGGGTTEPNLRHKIMALSSLLSSGHASPRTTFPLRKKSTNAMEWSESGVPIATLQRPVLREYVWIQCNRSTHHWIRPAHRPWFSAARTARMVLLHLHCFPFRS